jgi:signal transduction histidine kinase
MYSFAQNQTSQESAFQSEMTDSVRFQTLIKLSTENQYIDLPVAQDYANQAMEIAQSKKWNWATEIGYKQQAFLATINGDYAKAMRLDNLDLQLALSMRDSLVLAEATNNLGNDYYDLGKYDEAYYYFTQSYKIARSIEDSLKMTIAIYNIGRVLNELGQFELALNHFNFSEQISKDINDTDGAIYVQDARGELYLKKKDYKKAEEYLMSALNSLRARNLTIIEPRVLKRIAQLKFELKEFDQALAYYDSAMELHKKASNEFGVAEANLGISEIYIEQGKFDEAFKLLESVLETSKNINAQKMEIECLEKLSYLAEKKEDYKGALNFHKTFKSLEDSLYSQEMLEKLFQDQLRFQTEIKDHEIAELSKENAEQFSAMKRQDLLQNILVVVMALAGILLFTVYRSGQRRIKINKLLVDHQKEIKRRNDELEQLNQVKDKFFSIISHDLRSPLNSLSAILKLIEEKNITQEEFIKLSGELKVQFNHTRSLINNLLDWALLQMDKLKIQTEKIELAHFIDDNIKLLETISPKEVKLINMVPSGTYAFADPNMLNLIIRNLIMNAIKFSEAGGLIELSSKDQDKQFYQLSVKDYGIGISKDVQQLLFDKTSGYSTRGTANEKGTGLGLILCKEFVEKNGGKIWFESEEGKGSTFTFTIKKAIV